MAVEPKDISIDDYNKRVTEWGSETGVKIRSAIRTMATKGKEDLVKSLRLKTAKWYGEVDKLSYHFERHGVFVHKGVGRGYAMIGGKVMRVNGSPDTQFWKEYAKLKNREYKPKVLTAGINRKAVEWFNPVVKDNIEKLADLVAEMNTDRVVNVTKILIR